MNYQYWVIRFVPDPARGEFTNIGLVCGKDGADWAVAFDTQNLRNHGGLRSDLRELSVWRTNFEGLFDRGVENAVSSHWIEHLRTRQANLVQFAEPMPIGVHSANDGVNLLMPHLVTREPVSRRKTLDRTTMRLEVRDRLSHSLGLRVGHDLRMQQKVRIGKLSGSFDLLRLDQPDPTVTQVWGFNAVKIELLANSIQSWNYVVSRVRDSSGTVQLQSNRSLVLFEDVPIEVIYDPPAEEDNSGRRADIFESALEAWELNDVQHRALAEFRGEYPELDEPSASAAISSIL